MSGRQAALVLCALTMAGPARAQELEPRAYSPAPIRDPVILGYFYHRRGIGLTRDTEQLRFRRSALLHDFPLSGEPSSPSISW